MIRGFCVANSFKILQFLRVLVYICFLLDSDDGWLMVAKKDLTSQCWLRFNHRRSNLQSKTAHHAVPVRHGKLEEHRGYYDSALARAVARKFVIIVLALPWVYLLLLATLCLN